MSEAPAKDATNTGPGGAVSRRSLLGGAVVLGGLGPAVATGQTSSTPLGRDDFDFDGVFLNAAYTHPISRRTSAAIASFGQERRIHVGRAWTDDNYRDSAVAQFAALLHVDPRDLAVVPSTMAGENMLVDALSIGPDRGVVTDALHYFGSIALYQQKAAQGVPVSVVAARDFAIDLADIEAAITPATRLIAVSLTSGVNGFTYDLPALVAMAHRRGVLVYVDCIQAAGAIPIDLSASGVDFACCGGHKWLMGDFGAAFLYVRRDRLPLLRRRAVGWRQIADHSTHWLPFDRPGGADEFAFAPGPQGLFEIGTPAHATLASLATSIADVRRVGVSVLAKRRKPLIDRLQRELPRYGLRCLSPADNPSGIATFAFRDAALRIRPAFVRHGIMAQVATNRLRLSPSSYTTQADIDQVIEAVREAVAP